MRNLISRVLTWLFPSPPDDLTAVAEAAGVLIVDKQKVHTSLVQANAAAELADNNLVADDFLTWEWEFTMHGGDR